MGRFLQVHIVCSLDSIDRRHFFHMPDCSHVGASRPVGRDTVAAQLPVSTVNVDVRRHMAARAEVVQPHQQIRAGSRRDSLAL